MHKYSPFCAVPEADERKAKRLHLTKTIAVNQIADEKKNIIIPFKELSACAETLKQLEQKERSLIVLHGSYVTGKSSILQFLAETLCKLETNEVCFVDAVSTRFANDGGDLPATDFWRKFGWHLFGVNDVTSSDDAVDRLRTKYNKTEMKYFLLIDEILEILFHYTPRKEFVTFLGMVGAQGDANKFFGGFIGAGTYHTSVLLKSPETTAAQTPKDLTTSQSIPNQLSLLLKSKFVRSPFQGAHFIPVKPLTLEQTVKFLSTAEKESDVDILDEVKSDIHFYAAGNLGLVAFSSHLLVRERGARQKINMELWEYIKLYTLPHFLAQENRMVMRIVETLNHARSEITSYIFNLLVLESPIIVYDDDEKVCNELIELGLVSKNEGKIAIASPYISMLLLSLAYPLKKGPFFTVPLNEDNTINSYKLLCMAIHHIDPDVVTSRFSSNREGPAEACLQAELFAVLRAIGRSDKAKFKTFVEVKREPGVEQRLDLLLATQDGTNFAAFELKVYKLRKPAMEKAVTEQAERYRRFHKVKNMFVVNFVPSSATMDTDMPGKIGEVTCVYVRWDTGFTNLRIGSPAILANR